MKGINLKKLEAVLTNDNYKKVTDQSKLREIREFKSNAFKDVQAYSVICPQRHFSRMQHISLTMMMQIKDIDKMLGKN